MSPRPIPACELEALLRKRLEKGGDPAAIFERLRVAAKEGLVVPGNRVMEPDVLEEVRRRLVSEVKEPAAASREAQGDLEAKGGGDTPAPQLKRTEGVSNPGAGDVAGGCVDGRVTSSGDTPVIETNRTEGVSKPGAGDMAGGFAESKAASWEKDMKAAYRGRVGIVSQVWESSKEVLLIYEDFSISGWISFDDLTALPKDYHAGEAACTTPTKNAAVHAPACESTSTPGSSTKHCKRLWSPLRSSAVAASAVTTPESPRKRKAGRFVRKQETPTQAMEEKPRYCEADSTTGISLSHHLTHKRGFIVCLKCAACSRGTQMGRLKAECIPSDKKSRRTILKRWGKGETPEPRFPWPQPEYSSPPKGILLRPGEVASPNDALILLMGCAGLKTQASKTEGR